MVERVTSLAVHEDSVIVTAEGGLYQVREGDRTRLAALPADLRDPARHHSLAGGSRILFGTSQGLFVLDGTQLLPDEGLHALLGPTKDVRQVAVSADGRWAAAAATGLFVRSPEVGWARAQPRDGRRGWALRDVHGVAFDDRQRLWFANPQGVGVLGPEGWSLFTEQDGLPYNEFTTMSAGQKGAVWLGTDHGAIHFDGRDWRYRMSPRWLPDNRVHGIAVAPDGKTWLATAAGVGLLEGRPMTLAQKAQFFEEEIQKYHLRTPFGYVDSVRLNRAGDKSEWTQRDSDNDGLWTAMYGAGECFAYASDSGRSGETAGQPCLRGSPIPQPGDSRRISSRAARFSCSDHPADQRSRSEPALHSRAGSRASGTRPVVESDSATLAHQRRRQSGTGSATRVLTNWTVTTSCMPATTTWLPRLPQRSSESVTWWWPSRII